MPVPAVFPRKPYPRQRASAGVPWSRRPRGAFGPRFALLRCGLGDWLLYLAKRTLRLDQSGRKAWGERYERRESFRALFIDRCGRLGARRAFSPTSAYTGLYALDTFDVTNAFSVSAGGRLNVANIQLQDQLGSSLNETIMHFNPVIGATYKIRSDVAAYAGFSGANRAPTPLELGCANPAQPVTLGSNSPFADANGPNQFEQLPAYGVDASYQVTANLQVCLRVNSVFGAPFTDLRTLSPAQPRLVYAGLKATF